MSSLERLSIAGVRSFDPDDHQIITFNKPLTIIVGRNGVGKTTIIECLRYATTGSLPPGAKGEGFLHDPRLRDATEIRAVVKLQFTNLGGHRPVLMRAMSLTTLATGRRTFKTLDSSIAIDSGERTVSLSSRCADINVEMSTQLGVSKAVLENVIFCHQEESLWPLGDSTTVKKKFDDIFAATRYTQAIKEMGTLKDDKSSQLRLDRAELANLNVHRGKAQELKDKIDDGKRRIRDSNTDADQLQRGLDELSAQIAEIERKLEQISELGHKKNEKRHVASLKAVELEELKNIRMFTETEQELVTMLNEHRQRLEAANSSHGDLDRRKRAAETELAQFGDEIMRENENMGRLKAREENIERAVSSRDRAVRDIAKRVGMPVHGDKISQEAAERFVDALKAKVADTEREQTRRREERRLRMRSIDGDLQQLMQQKAKHDETVRRSNQSMNDARQQITTIEAELLRTQASAADKELTSQQIALAKRALAEHERQIAAENLEDHVRTLESERDQYDHEYNGMVEAQMQLARFADLRAKMELNQQEAERERADAGKKLMDVRSKLERVIDDAAALTVDNCQQAVSAALSEAAKQQQRAQQSAQQANDALVRARQDLENRRRQLQEADRQVESIRMQHPDIDEEQDIVARLEELDAQVSEVQRNHSFYDSFMEVYQKLISLAERRQQCPVCNRGLSANPADADSVAAFVAKQQNTIADLPRQKAAAEEDLATRTSERDHVRALQPLWTQCRELVTVRIPELRRQEADINESLPALERANNDAAEELRAINIKMENIRVLQNHASAIAAHVQKATQAQRTATIFRDQLAGIQGTDGGGLNVQERMRLVQQQRDTTKAQLSEVHASIKRHAEKRQRLLQDVAQYEREERALDERLGRRAALELQLQQLEEDLVRLERERADAETALRETEERTAAQTVSRNDLQTAHDAHEAELSRRVAQLREDLHKLTELVELIGQFYRNGADKERPRTQDRLATLAQRKGELEGVLARISDEEADISGRLVQIKEIEHDVSQYLRYLRLQREIAATNREIAHLDREAAKHGAIDELAREKQTLRGQWQEATTKKASQEGGVKELRRQVQTMERELLEEPYKSLEKAYNAKLVDVKTLELAIADLNKYIKAVDRAVMSYHAIKMDEINKIMRELWVDIYQGQDIDSIEIRSEDERGARGSYNYRVVMNKGGVALDMRGRCSAGQKVLACLLIRLALAETFGLNCGVLALDEPTTNLDVENADRLATALDRIIRLRSRQSNFQLILITHDEMFMRKLGAHAEYYYHVRKNPQTHHSVIRRIPMNELE